MKTDKVSRKNGPPYDIIESEYHHVITYYTETVPFQKPRAPKRSQKILTTEQNWPLDHWQPNGSKHHRWIP